MVHVMLDKKSDITAEIGSRICHDLISPIGAINNGLELLELSGAVQSPEMMLIADSVRAANGKVRFLRVAFGDALGDNAIGTSEITDILSHNFMDNRLTVNWRVLNALSRQDLKVCFLTLMCLENTLPYGGVITVSDNDQGWTFDVTGRDVKIDDIIDLDQNCFCIKNGPASVQYTLLQQMDTSKNLSFRCIL